MTTLALSRTAALPAFNPFARTVGAHRPGDRWQLPSGRVAEVRRVIGSHFPEAVLRYVDADGSLTQAETYLTLTTLVMHGRRVP